MGNKFAAVGINAPIKSKTMETNHRGEERRDHGGIYATISWARGQKTGYIDCPFCGESIRCFVWSVAGSGKKCNCGAILYQTNATKKIKP